MLNLPNANDLQKLDLQTLKSIDQSIDSLMFKQSSGEPYAKHYRKNKKNFNQLVKETTQFNTAVKAYFKAQLERIYKLVNIGLITADDTTDFINTDAWDEENQQLVIVIHPKVETLFDLGVEAAQVQLKMHMSIDSSSAPVQKFLRNYTLSLAKDINNTTKADIKEQIKTSLALGETRQELEGRITNVIDNPYRAQMIAQTESIRAFSAGRIAVGQRMGVQKKQWITNGAVDEACTSAAGQGIIPINESFINGDDYPPAHPNCKCAIDLVMEQASAVNEEQDQGIDTNYAQAAL